MCISEKLYRNILRQEVEADNFYNTIDGLKLLGEELKKERKLKGDK